jgi:hypothetical protein
MALFHALKGVAIKVLNNRTLQRRGKERLKSINFLMALFQALKERGN